MVLPAALTIGGISVSGPIRSGMKPELSALKPSGSGPDRGAAAEQRLAHAAEDQHAGQRDDEARYSVIGDPVALRRADGAADDQADDRHDQRIAEKSRAAR